MRKDKGGSGGTIINVSSVAGLFKGEKTDKRNKIKVTGSKGTALEILCNNSDSLQGLCQYPSFQSTAQPKVVSYPTRRL